MILYRVEISEEIEGKIGSQILYISQDSARRASAWKKRLDAAIFSLDYMPKRYTVDPEASKRVGETVRKLVFERNYLVFYRVLDEEARVELVNFRHVAQLPSGREA